MLLFRVGFPIRLKIKMGLMYFKIMLKLRLNDIKNKYLISIVRTALMSNNVFSPSMDQERKLS